MNIINSMKPTTNARTDIPYSALVVAVNTVIRAIVIVAIANIPRVIDNVRFIFISFLLT